MDNLQLTEYSNKVAYNLSGGNKRKLAVSLALLGNPPILMLDEPSTGIDPNVRRHLWNLIKKTTNLRK